MISNFYLSYFSIAKFEFKSFKKASHEIRTRTSGQVIIHR